MLSSVGMLERPCTAARSPLLDELRGFALVNMVGFHACYDVVFLFGIALSWFPGPISVWWQRFICFSFLFVAGVCTRLSSHPYRRVLRVAAAAAAITLVTWVPMPEQLVLFGILHGMALFLLLYAVFQKGLARIPPAAGFALFLCLFAVTYAVPMHRLGLGAFSIPLPETLYRSYWLSFLGFPSPDFWSSDYFPPIPYLFLFLAGSYAGNWLPKLPPAFHKSHSRALAFLGRHSLGIYLLHQPIVYGALWIFLH